MKIICFYLFILLTLSLNINAQYKIQYKIDYIHELEGPKKYSEKSFLYLNNNKSIFATTNLYKADSIMKLVLAGTIEPSSASTGGDFTVSSGKRKYPFTFFHSVISKNYSSKKISNQVKIVRKNYSYETENLIKWKLLDDTLTINNMVCNKATSTFEGRDYEAWYTSEIPISDGPYKFWGLPGLILKVSDTENHYVFTMESLEKINVNEIYNPFDEKKIIPVSYENYKKILVQSVEDVYGLMAAQGARHVSKDGKDPSTLPKKEKNIIERFQ